MNYREAAGDGKAARRRWHEPTAGGQGAPY